MPQTYVLDQVVFAKIPNSDWKTEPSGGTAPNGSKLWMVKTKLQTPGTFLFMLAKDYTVPPDNVTTPEILLREIYPTIYRKTFDEVHVDSVAPLARGVALADDMWQAEYRFVHSARGAISKIERVKCVRDHVLLVSAEGAPDDMTRYASDVQVFLNGVQYAPL